MQQIYRRQSTLKHSLQVFMCTNRRRIVLILRYLQDALKLHQRNPQSDDRRQNLSDSFWECAGPCHLGWDYWGGAVFHTRRLYVLLPCTIKEWENLRLLSDCMCTYYCSLKKKRLDQIQYGKMCKKCIMMIIIVFMAL